MLFCVVTGGDFVRGTVNLLLVYKANGAVVSRTICGVPPKNANTRPPNV